MPTVGQYGAEGLLDSTSRLMPNTAVAVLNPDNSMATLYTSLAGTVGGIGAPYNPAHTDGEGNLLFYAAPGQYQLQIAGVVVATVYVSLPANALGSPLVVDFTSPRYGGISGSDWSPAIANVSAAMGAAPYVLTAPPSATPYSISQNHVLGDGQTIQCAGGGQIFAGVPGVIFKCTAAGAGILVQGTGGLCYGFRVDGNSIATTPFQEGSVAHPGSGRVFIDVGVVNSAQDNWTILTAQNSQHICCATSDAARDGLYISGGAGGLSFSRCEFSAGIASRGRYDVRIDCLVDGTSSVGVAYPLYIHFDHCFMERQTTGGTSQLFVANGGSGSTGPNNISFADCQFNAPPSATGPCIDISGNSYVTFDRPAITCGAPGALRIADTCNIHLMAPLIQSSGTAAYAISLAAGSPITVIGDLQIFGTFTARFAGAGAANQDLLVRYHSKVPLEVIRTGPSDSVIAGGYTGYSGYTWVDFASGVRWYYNGFLNDTSFGPSTPGVGNGVATNKGMGFWGHAAPATQPAAPVTLADVIAIIRGCGLSA